MLYALPIVCFLLFAFVFVVRSAVVTILLLFLRKTTTNMMFKLREGLQLAIMEISHMTDQNKL